jgi:FSR family fosmidomycin resistance protein-like MFS transporter
MGAFSALALVSTALLAGVGLWAKRYGIPRLALLDEGHRISATSNPVSAANLRKSMAVLLALIFSKFVYLASIVSFYTFYLMHRFGVSVRNAQMHLFLFAAAVAAGTLAGGPLGDRIGRKQVIWFSILGALPFTLALPHAGLFWTGVLSVFVGFVLASAFPAIVVYGQELIPGRVGMVSGLFFGLSFGAAGSGAALLGAIADATSIDYVYGLCSFLPALGLLAAFLPELRGPALASEADEPDYTDALAPPSQP